MSSVLFDVPGPKARMRYRLLSIIGILAVAGFIAFVIYRFAVSGQFAPSKWEWLEYEAIQLELLKGLGNTLRGFAVGSVLALAFGALFAAARLSDHAFFRGPALVVVEFFRAIPLLIMMFIFYYGLPTVGIKMTPFMAVVLSLMLYNGSVLAEIFRAGINSLPKGQSEAAYALGMRKTQVMVLILLPQALRAMLPTIISQLVVLLKDTALGFIITFQELLHYAKFLGSLFQFGFPQVPVALVVGAMYVTLCLLLTALANYLQRRNARNKKVIQQPAKEEVQLALV